MASTSPREQRYVGVRIRHWTIVSRIGGGAFGNVYKVTETVSGAEYAMKLERRQPNTGTFLPTEAEVLGVAGQTRPPCARICALIEFCVVDAFTSYLVMPLLGSSIDSLRRSCPQAKFSASTAIRTSIQCLEAMKEVHSINFVHRDIKSANFAIGATNRRFVYIFDFGLACRFRDNGQLVQPRPPPLPGFVGTVRYASTTAHECKELGPIDDGWSWFYMTMEMMSGSLPWAGIPNRNRVLAEKLRVFSDTKPALLSHLSERDHDMFCHIIGEFRDKSYKSELNYAVYQRLLRVMMQRNGYTDNEPYDWERDQNAQRQDLVVDDLISSEEGPMSVSAKADASEM